MPASDKLTFRDLPDSLEVILLYVAASYGFFFAFHSLCPLVSLIMSVLVLAEYTRSVRSNLQIEHEHHRQQLSKGNASKDPFTTPFFRKRLALQVAFALIVLTPPLVVTLVRGNLYGTVGRKYQRSHPQHNQEAR